MAKTINKELKEILEGQIECEGFDYAMTQKVSPDEWTEGIVPDDLKEAWHKYLAARKELKIILEEYGIDPQ